MGEYKVPSEVIFLGINHVSEEVLAKNRILKDKKEGTSLKLKTFKTLQYITRILHIVIECNNSNRMHSSNGMLCSIHDFTFLWQTQKLKNKSLLSLEKKNFCLHYFRWNLLCCLHNQSRWQTDLAACLPARARLRKSHWQACKLCAVNGENVRARVHCYPIHVGICVKHSSLFTYDPKIWNKLF